ncbi:MAG: hypothetical protein ACT4OO_02905 [Nitrospiraceae bacterium]
MTRYPVPSEKDILLPDVHPPTEEVSIILLQDAVRAEHVQGKSIYVLADDVCARNVTAVCPPISYKEMLDMVFAADTVMVL